MEIKQISKLEDVMLLIQTFGTKSGFVYRGQADEIWELRANLFRSKIGGVIDPLTQLEKFKKYLIGRKDVNDLSENEIWAIGQHYGLYTPLLDWSISIAVALFFSFENDQIISDNRSLFILNADKMNKKFCDELISQIKIKYPEFPDSRWDKIVKPEWKGKFLLDLHEKNNLGSSMFFVEEIIRDLEKRCPRMFSPKTFGSDRILAQRGLFSIVYNNENFSKILDNINGNEWLIKVNIDSSLRKSILEYLDSVNVNYLSLFPDIMGAARYTNYKLKHYQDVQESLSEKKFWL